MLEGYSALRGGTLEHPVIIEIAERLGRTPAQVIIRWHLQHGIVVIPKSVNAERIRSNADVAGFELTADDIGRSTPSARTPDPRERLLPPAGAGQQRGGRGDAGGRVRSTEVPIRTGSAPTAANAASSSSLMPPSGPTTITISPRPGTGRSASGPDAASWSTTGTDASRSRSTTSDVVDHVGDLGEPRAPGLLGGLAGRRAPLGQRLGLLVAAPHRHRAGRRPRHDDVDADLGEHLDGELAAVALGDRLHDDDPRHLRLGGRDRVDRRGQRRLGGRGHGAGRRRAGAVGQRDLLADPDPLDHDRVPGLVTDELDGVARDGPPGAGWTKTGRLIAGRTRRGAGRRPTCAARAT